MIRVITYVIAGVLATIGTSGWSVERPAAAESCAGCHQLQTPPETPDLQERIERTAPPLYYAGNKFRKPWLVDWLQNPDRIRPAGDYPPAATKMVDGEAVIDTDALINHPALDAPIAAAVADWLMTLTPRDDLIQTEAGYTPGTISERMGAMDFVKFKGCGGCHKDSPKYGGVSGPELYTAWQRLQPEFIISYTSDPTAWERRSLMPAKGLKTPQIHKLTNYLKVIGEKED